jgi:ABC-type Fe3+/spermidine/putrescine transport system ATPase subunit
VTRVRLVRLARSFGSVWAVREISLEIAEGEFFSLLGPSGCGKTTTLRMIAGLEKPTAGQIWFGDDEVTAVLPQHRNVGLVFQSYAVFPTMTVFDNVAYGLRIRRISSDEVRRRVEQVLETLGLTGLAARMPGQLSGGQQQRVALARALAIQPRVLLLDEPLSNLDAKLRVEVRAELKRLQREVGITTLYVSHDQEEALSISDRIGVMTQGHLEQVGSPEEIYRRPATRFVAEFVGEGAILDGVLRRDGGSPRVVVGPGAELPVQQAAAPDGPVWVCVRPEAVRVVRDGSGRGPGHVGTVEHLEFVGPSLRAEVRIQGFPRTVRLAGSSVELAGAFQIGSRITVEIDPAGVSMGLRGDDGLPAKTGDAARAAVTVPPEPR